MSTWRNWQTRTTQNRSGNRVGSSPIVDTISIFNTRGVCMKKNLCIVGDSMIGTDIPNIQEFLRNNFYIKKLRMDVKFQDAEYFNCKINFSNKKYEVYDSKKRYIMTLDWSNGFKIVSGNPFIIKRNGKYDVYIFFYY